jgi:tetratricopeptide (TPR) repeat protein
VTLPLRPTMKRALLVLVCVGFVSIYILRVRRVYLAQRSVYSAGVDVRVDQQLKEIERAVHLVPDNAEFSHLLGLQLSAADQDDKRAIASLLEAVHLNPNNGGYWLDLASVYQATGNGEKQNEAVQAAIRAEPGNPDVAAEAAQYFLVGGDVDQAFPLFRQSLAEDPEAAKSILPMCWRQTHDANVILSRVIPDSPELQLSFLSLLTAQRETAAAKQAWQYLVASHRPFPPQLSFFYFDYLLHEHDVAGFARAWRELAGLSPNLQAYLPNDNLIVNGGFEQQLLNSGFDWRYAPADHLTAGIDDSVAHSGSHSLSLSYDGGPAYEAGWTQYVPVQSNTDYEFSAWIKSENVTSASGPRIALVDAFSGANLLLTDDVLDTHPWQEMMGTLRIPAGTELIAVKITRAPAGMRIRGRVWIDDLRLVKR